MSLLQTIKTDQLTARKARDQLKTKILTTLLSEASRPGLDDGKRESTDDEVIVVIKKFIKNNNETLAECHDDDLLVENDILNGFLPTQLNEEEIRNIITKCGATNIGQAMKKLKTDYAGLFDGGVASKIAKEMLS